MLEKNPSFSLPRDLTSESLGCVPAAGGSPPGGSRAGDVLYIRIRVVPDTTPAPTLCLSSRLRSLGTPLDSVHALSHAVRQGKGKGAAYAVASLVLCHVP